jgi:uracil-DNA glycosylase family 4
MFTGDRSGDFLYAALHRAGLANQPTSVSADDGLALSDVLVAATCHCAPPDNKPTPEELRTCGQYLERLWKGREWTTVLCLGGIAWDALFRLAGVRKTPFGHGTIHRLEGGPVVIGSYHPSQQNTFTGRLTPPMMDAVMAMFRDAE